MTVKKAQCLFILLFKRLNLCLGNNICSFSLVILTWRVGELDYNRSNPSGMTRKKRKKPIQQKSIHEFITKRTLTSPTTRNQPWEWETRMTHLNTATLQIPMTLPQLAVTCKLTKETSQKNLHWTLVILATLFTII